MQVRPSGTSNPIGGRPNLKWGGRPRKHRSPGARFRRWLGCCTILVVLGTLLLAQVNSAFGAWTADVLRAVLGAQATAQIEAWYLGIGDTIHQIEYRLGGQPVNPPWTSGATPPVGGASPSSTPALVPMALPTIAPIITPALVGEGVWTTEGVPASPAGLPPLVAKTFLRPDPARPYALTTLLQFDLRALTLHMVAGTSQPGGPRGVAGPGVIPPADQQGNRLLAAFNGGFQYADGHYGMMVNGTVYVPPQPGMATIALTRSGQVILGAWGVDPGLNSANTTLSAWRQNEALLINHGTLNPLTQDGAAWGGTVLNSAYTWRSGLGITAQGRLLYVAGNALSAETLGQTLQAAGAVMAMQTDINPNWVRAFLYQRDATGAWQITKLHPGMQGTGDEYLQSTARDFFYLTFNAPLQPSPGKPGQE